VGAVGSPGEGTITVTEEGKYGKYLTVTTDNPDDVGKEIEFYVELPDWTEAQKADQTATYDSDTHQVDLTVTSEDTTPPTVEITSTVSGSTNTSPVPMTATFSEDVTGFEVGDITVGNGAAGSFAGSGADYTFDVTPTADGEVTVDIHAGVAEDAAGNPNFEAATQFSITYDSTVPTATVSPEDTATDVALAAAVTATFGEDVLAGALGDITITGATGVSATLDANIIAIAHDAFDLDTTYTVTIPAEAVEDLAGNPSAEISWSFTTAAVAVTHSLTMAVVGQGTVTPGSGTYAEGDMTITAISASGWEFSAWSTADMTEIADATLAVTTLTLDEDKTVTATFTEEEAFDPDDYDTDEDGEFSKDETLAAVTAYLAGSITKANALEVVKLYFS